MPDRKKVIYSLERCFCHVADACRDCAYTEYPCNKCMEMLILDTLELLKAQDKKDDDDANKSRRYSLW